MSNIQKRFLVPITEENGTYNYKNTKDFNFMTLK